MTLVHPRRKSAILTRLLPGESITVGSTTGSETLAEAREIFSGYLSPFFTEWGTAVPSVPTSPVKIEVYELRRDADFQQIFASLGTPRELCLTQGQILNFVRFHRNLLWPDVSETLFLFEAHGEFFVAAVVDTSGPGLRAAVYCLGQAIQLEAALRYRVVVPA